MFFVPDWHAISFERLELEADLRGALERGELTVHYQPVVALASGRITGTEALLRWDHPTRGSVSPADFIPVAEETGLIRPIGTWVLDHAVAQTRRWQRLPGCEGMSVAVNVSVEQLQPGFADSIRDVLERHGVSAGSLVIEVTESLLLDELTVTVEAMREISALGVQRRGRRLRHRVLGAAPAPQLPVDVLKIDRSFVAQLGDGAGDPLVTAMIALGHGLGLTVVAEGVETGAAAALPARARLRRRAGLPVRGGTDA
jgi:EAL domain-containing protein (putative c-di-GMP-specific phosphodiesterase class I)